MPLRTGQVYTVTSLADVIDAGDGELTFTEALAAANRNQPVGDAPAGSYSEGDTIRFAEGVSGSILLDGQAIAIMGDLTLEGPGADLLTFDAQGQGRVFSVLGTGSVVLSGATITGGNAEDGAGVFHQGGSLSITDCVVAGNVSTLYGGGIYHTLGELIVADSSFEDNSCLYRGAGIAVRYGSANVTDSAFIRNAASGGGIYADYASLDVEGTEFIENAGQDGGGLYCYETAARIARSRFTGNRAESYGGAVSNSGLTATMTMTDCTIEKGSARWGGGISNPGDMTMLDCTLSGNHADTGGGAVINSGSLDMVNSVLAANYAGEEGGRGDLLEEGNGPADQQPCSRQRGVVLRRRNLPRSRDDIVSVQFHRYRERVVERWRNPCQ